MGKKNKCPECPKGLPAWLATFGDLMSLLLTFFVLLLSFSSMQESKFQKARGSILGALGLIATNTGETYSPMNAPAPQVDPAKIEAEEDAEEFLEAQILKEVLTEEIKEALKEEISDAEADQVVNITASVEGVRITISDLDNSIFFKSGEAELKNNFTKILDAVGKVIADENNRYDFMVEGHTDNTPINTEKYPSNWELSVARSLSVVKYMISKYNIPPNQVTAIGYGEYRPIDTNKTIEGRAKNRRVEMFLEINKEKKES